MNKKGLSAAQINNPDRDRDYGLYFKFTPGGKDDGYFISRLDFVILDSQMNTLYSEGFNFNKFCQSGHYWYWNFFSLEDFFQKMNKKEGQVKAGTYTMDIYFNSLWAGSTRFTINK